MKSKIGTEKKSDSLDDVFEKPVGKILLKKDPQFEKEVNEYLDSVKKTVEEEEAKESNVKTRRKNNVSEEGKKVMLANLKKGREQRKVNINKEHERRQDELKKELEEVKNMLVKVGTPANVEKSPPQKVNQSVPEPIQTQKPVINTPPAQVIIQPPKPKMISMLKKPLW